MPKLGWEPSESEKREALVDELGAYIDRAIDRAITAGSGQYLHRIPSSGKSLCGLSRNQVYQLLKLGLLEGRRVGMCTLITDESLRNLPNRLPHYIPGDSQAAKRMVDAKRAKKK